MGKWTFEEESSHRMYPMEDSYQVEVDMWNIYIKIWIASLKLVVFPKPSLEKFRHWRE